MLLKPPNKDELVERYNIIKKFVNRTPILTSSTINKICDAEIYFKCENFQKVGAFKFRGASNAVSKLGKDQLKNGVGTHSSGNHAAALSLAAKNNGITAKIVMPKTVPQIKINAVKEYGGEIIFCEPNLESREIAMQKVISESGVTFIHPYDNYDIIEGQATCAMEIFEEINDLDFILAPVGGGGLMSGTCLATKYFSPKTKAYGAEPENADDAYRSVRDNKLYPPIKPNTIADGLLTALSEKTFNIIKEHITEICLVNEDEIKSAMRMVWERMKIIIEPSSAVTLAVILKNKKIFMSKKIALIFSGGNVDLAKLPW